MLPLVTQDGRVFACGEATNGRLGLGISTGNILIPRQISALSQYVVKKVAVHSGTFPPTSCFTPLDYAPSLPTLCRIFNKIVAGLKTGIA